MTDQNPPSPPAAHSEEDGMWRHLEEENPAAEPTPQLTQSQVKRLATPMMGMVITMAVLMGILAVMWFMNPEPDVTYTRDEDVAEAAGWADGVAAYSPISPEVPDEWSANYARWENRPEYGVDVWEVGYTTEAVTFVGFAQTDEPNPAWINAETEQAPEVGHETIQDLDFQVHQDDDRRYYVLTAEANTIDGTTVVIGGDADTEDFDTALEAIIGSLGQEVTATDDDGEDTSDD